MKSARAALLWIFAGWSVALAPRSGAATSEATLRSIHHEETNRQAFSLPFSGLSLVEMRAFVGGNRAFNLRWAAGVGSSPAVDGLGPTFVQASCSACHLRDGRSRLPDANGEKISVAVIKVAPRRQRHQRWVEERFGDALQTSSVRGVAAEASARIHWRESSRLTLDGVTHVLMKPQIRVESALFPSLRRRAQFDVLIAPAVFGLGLLENVPEAEIVAREDTEDRDHDGISGRANRVRIDDVVRVARFGWKANVASLREQIALAAWSDMGLTSAPHATENCPSRQTDCREHIGQDFDLNEQTISVVETYLRLLAVPAPRTEQSIDAARGRDVFRALNCMGCHVESLRTGDASSFDVLNGQLISPYTDLLLHDLGEGLASHLPLGDTSASEWRTPPLWGLGLQQAVSGHQRFLHDGRANGLIEAILWHGGEAQSSRDQFLELSQSERVHLMQFLESL